MSAVGAGLAKRTMVGLSVAVVVSGASAFTGAASAGADSIAGSQARIQALQHEVVQQATRIRGLTLAYEQADARAGALAQQVAADQANLTRLQGVESATASDLRSDAILSYTGGAASAPSGNTGSADPAIRAEYLQVAAGNLSDAVDLYRTQEGQVASAEAILAGELRASRVAVLAADSARGRAIAQAGQVQAQLVAVQNQLQQLMAAEAAAEAAAAAERARAVMPQGLPVQGGLVDVVRTVVGSGGTGGVWLQLRECESGNDYRANTGNGFYGAYQFTQQTWSNLGYPGRPDLEPPAMQDQAAQKLQAESGWGQWPACSAALGLH